MKSGAFKITVIYVIIGFLWIALSDRMLYWLKGRVDISVVLFVDGIKGFIYVLITAVVLYKLILHYNAKLDDSQTQQ